MNKNWIAGLVVSLFASAPAFAAGASEFNGADLLAASEAALDVFKKENGDHAAHLTGFKTWKSGVDAKVKIYVLHGGATMEMNYLCIKSANQIRCSAN